jgi:hypothetical protein
MALIAGWLPLHSSPALSSDCSLAAAKPIVIPANKNKGNSDDQPKRAYRLPDLSIVFLGTLGIDADGSPRAYGPNGKGLDDTANAGSPGRWFGLATDARDCGPSGKPLIQDASGPAPGFYVSTTTMFDASLGDCRNQRSYVDASSIPFVALPPLIATINADHAGKLAMVGKLSGGTSQGAIQADQAPAYGFGEASIELARRFGVDSNPRSGGTGARDFVYVVFVDRSGYPSGSGQVEEEAALAFKHWGGEARLEACRRALSAAPR